MQKIILLQVLSLVLITGVFLWFQEKKNSVSEKEPVEQIQKLVVVTTFYPLEDFARAVGGERVTVTSIVPAGAEPHEYEPTPQDILSAYQSDVFLLNGAGVDAWAEKIRPELEVRGVKVVQMSELMTLLPGAREEGEESAFDPHFWLDPVLVDKEVVAIAEAFSARDEAGKKVYVEKSGAFLKSLSALHDAYRSGLAACALDTVVTSHNAFSYMAKRYGFVTIPVAGLSPEAEASPRQLAETALIIREKGIKHIFFETLVSPKVAETLAREVGAETLTFNPLEGLTDEERAQGKNYLTTMRDNLNNLQIALQCQK
ncbi:MAG: zinc ABC transporter substrate-binding protein [Candidatus Moraniibacteriota bacterium]